LYKPGQLAFAETIIMEDTEAHHGYMTLADLMIYDNRVNEPKINLFANMTLVT
jgi:hypothetical protein